MDAIDCKEGPIATDGISIHLRFPSGGASAIRSVGEQVEHFFKRVVLSGRVAMRRSRMRRSRRVRDHIDLRANAILAES